METTSNINHPLVEMANKSTRPVRYVYFLTGLACLNSINLGYDVGCVGGAALIMRDDMDWSALQTESFVASANLVAVLGALLAPRLCDGFGRLRTFSVSCLVFITGVMLVIGSPSMTSTPYGPIMVGRVLTGLGIGLGLAIDPLYIAEVSPPQFRGQLVSMSELSINMGILLGMAADFAFLGLPEGTNWRLMLGMGLVMPCILFMLTLTVMPESPRWLLANERREEATHILTKTHYPEEDISAVIEEIMMQIEFDRKVAAEGWTPITSPTPSVKRMLFAGVGLGACQQANGSEAFIYFSPTLLEKAGISNRQATFGFTLLIGVCKTSFIFVGAHLVDTWGRRPLLFLSTGLMSLFLIFLAAVFPGGHYGLPFDAQV